MNEVKRVPIWARVKHELALKYPKMGFRVDTIQSGHHVAVVVGYNMVRHYHELNPEDINELEDKFALHGEPLPIYTEDNPTMW